jgi:hypothetical protein
MSIFGPGVGECVAMHVGNGEWIVVDSCLGPTGEPVAPWYLTALGASLASVKVCLITHFHDDHIRGAAAAAEEFAAAELWCSAALADRDWLAHVAAHERPMAEQGSGIDEFSKLLELGSSRPAGSVRWASAQHLIWERRVGVPVKVVALSPSDHAQTRALYDIASELARLVEDARLGNPKRRLLRLGKQNHVSVAIWVAVGQLEALLGADVEVTGESTTGWEGVLSLGSPPWTAPAQFFKIPHHGSAGADHPEAWDRLVQPDAMVGVTPFTRHHLPLQTDVQRIVAYGRSAFIASPADASRRIRRSAEVEKLVRASGHRLQARGAYGHVRFRCPMADPSSATVELFPAAEALSQPAAR